MSQLQKAYQELKWDKGFSENEFFRLLYAEELNQLPNREYQTIDGRYYSMSINLVPGVLAYKYPKVVQFVLQGNGRFYMVTSQTNGPMIKIESQWRLNKMKAEVMADLWDLIIPGARVKELSQLHSDEKLLALASSYDLFLEVFATHGMGQTSVYRLS